MIERAGNSVSSDQAESVSMEKRVSWDKNVGPSSPLTVADGNVGGIRACQAALDTPALKLSVSRGQKTN